VRAAIAAFFILIDFPVIDIEYLELLSVHIKKIYGLEAFLLLPGK